MKYFFFRFSLLLILLFTGSSFTSGPKRYEIKTIVIDAGHGGHDTGCLGSSGKEKDIALGIALKLGKLIQENYPGIKVVYTRKTDVFVELHERAEIANRNKAELFICIHANSGGSAYGTETFVLGLHRAEENLAVSKRENSAILMEKDYKTKYDGFDPNSAEANIIFRLYQSTYLQQSLLFASKVQDQFTDYAGRLNRGVKQAGLLVLARTTMPGVLVETGFLTNRDEEKFLLSNKGQNLLATSIYRAFKEYKIDMEETPDDNKNQAQVKNTEVAPSHNSNTDTLPVPVEKNQEKKPVREADKKAPLETENLMTPLPEQKNRKKDATQTPVIRDTTPLNNPTPVRDANKSPEATGENKTVLNNKEESLSNKRDTVLSGKQKAQKSSDLENHPEQQLKQVVVSKKSEEKATEPDIAKPVDIYYTIQLGATERPNAKDRERYNKTEDLKERPGEDGITRFTTGIYYSLDKAIIGQNQMRSKGFKDAFVTAYNKNKRITIQEAEKIKKSK